MSQDQRFYTDSASTSSGEFDNFGNIQDGPLGALPGSSYSPAPAPILRNNYMSQSSLSNGTKEIDFGFPGESQVDLEEESYELAQDPNTSSDQLIITNTSIATREAPMVMPKSTNKVKLTSKTDISLNPNTDGSISLAIAIETLLPFIIKGVEVVAEIVEQIANHIRTRFEGQDTIKVRELTPAIKEHLRTEGTKAIYNEKFQNKTLISTIDDDTADSGILCLPKLSLTFNLGKIILNSHNTQKAASKFVDKKLFNVPDPSALKAALAGKLMDLGTQTKQSMSELHDYLKETTMQAGVNALKAVKVLTTAVKQAEAAALSGVDQTLEVAEIVANSMEDNALSVTDRTVEVVTDGSQSSMAAAATGTQDAANAFANMNLQTIRALQALVTQHLALKAEALNVTHESHDDVAAVGLHDGLQALGEQTNL